MTELHTRLARACAHGTRQMGFVNELLAGEAYVTTKTVPAPGIGLMEVCVYGDSGMESKSWASLKRRLASNGFIIKYGPTSTSKIYRRKIEMRFGA